MFFKKWLTKGRAASSMHINRYTSPSLSTTTTITTGTIIQYLGMHTMEINQKNKKNNRKIGKKKMEKSFFFFSLSGGSFTRICYNNVISSKLATASLSFVRRVKLT